jgi:DNA-binding LacI/PurR family transcriptional regulator
MQNREGVQKPRNAPIELPCARSQKGVDNRQENIYFVNVYKLGSLSSTGWRRKLRPTEFMQKASIKDVARLANVSIATVSRVLNDNDRVKSHLRQRVLQVMQELEYEPSGIARTMRKQRKNFVGLIIADIQNPFFTDLVRAIEETAYRSQYTVLLGSSDDQLEKEQLYLDVLAQERISGFIVIPLSGDPETYRFNRPLPLVFVDWAVPGVQADAVLLDNVQGSYIAVRHLLELGHRRIGLVTTPATSTVGNERTQGYIKALREYGLPVDTDLIRHGGSAKETGGYAATCELLAQDPPPTALFAVNNVRTVGMLQAVQAHRIGVPDELSLVGFDDAPWLSLVTPPLTTVCQPIYEIGAEAMRLLMQRLDGDRDSPPVTTLMPPQLIVRKSTTPPRRSYGFERR